MWQKDIPLEASQTQESGETELSASADRDQPMDAAKTVDEKTKIAVEADLSRAKMKTEMFEEEQLDDISEYLKVCFFA